MLRFVCYWMLVSCTVWFCHVHICCIHLLNTQILELICIYSMHVYTITRRRIQTHHHIMLDTHVAAMNTHTPTPSRAGEYKHTTTCTNSTTIIPYMVMLTPSVPCLRKLHVFVYSTHCATNNTYSGHFVPPPKSALYIIFHTQTCTRLVQSVNEYKESSLGVRPGGNYTAH